MTSSGTYNFQLTNGQCAIAAYRRIQVRTPTLRQEHFDAAYMEMNLSMVHFSNLQPNLWEVQLNTISLEAGTATYSLPKNTVLILDAYITTNSGNQQTNRYMTPFSRTDYASLANPTTQGAPTQYWMDRLASPTVTLWPVPDGNGPYTMGYYSVSQIQDAQLPNGQTPDLPYLWLDAYVADLAHRLSRIYAPQFETQRAADAQRAWDIAAAQNIEPVSLSIAPPIGRWYPR
jgi:hypothetical protein